MRKFTVHPKGIKCSNSASNRIIASESQFESGREQILEFLYDDDYDTAEEYIAEFMGGYENDVADEMQIFLEPSTQGHQGAMFITDESGEDRFDTISVDISEWVDKEFELIQDCSTESELISAIRSWFEGLIES